MRRAASPAAWPMRIGTLDGAHRNLALRHFLNQFEDQQSVLAVFMQRKIEGFGEGQSLHLHLLAANANAVPLVFKNGLNVEGLLLAVAQDGNRYRLIFCNFQTFDHLRQRGYRFAVH